MASTTRPADGAEPVLARADQVLRAFDGVGGPLGLSQIAAASGLPKSTVHRLAAQLVQLRFLERSGTQYWLGMRLFELGELVPVKRRLRSAALPFMQDLYESTHETVHLAVLDGEEVVYIEKIQGHGGLRLPSRVGGRLPVLCTGVGKAILAFASEESRAAALAGELRPLTPHSIRDREELAEELERVRSAGVAFDREEAALGTGCVAAPVLVHGEVVAGLSLSVPIAQYQPARLAPAVMTAARALSRRLSGPQPIARRR